MRAARNQSMFRAINEQMTKLNEAFQAATATYVIACECADTSCLFRRSTSRRTSTRGSARSRTASPSSHGHLDADIEDVVAEADGYQVAEKRGEAAATVSALTLPQGGVDGN